MRIGIDYTAAVCQGAGIGRYTRELVRALAQADRRNEYLLFFPRDAQGWEAAEATFPPNFSGRRLPFTERALAVLWQRFRLPLPVEIFTGRLDLLHSPDFVLPPQRHGRAIVTVHDLSFLRFPECYPVPLRRYLKTAVPRAVARADLLVACSQATRRDLVELLGLPPAKVEVIYEGVGEEFRPVEDRKVRGAVRAKYSLPEKFVLNLGTLQPRKNQVQLIRAYDRMVEATGLPHHLAIVGGKGWLWEGILAAAESSPYRERIHFLGYVPDEDLPVLYSLAEAFIFPSLYEGFGLPVLEAMAAGTPVVAASTSSLPEVVGEAGLLVDPGDAGALAAAMAQVLRDEGLRAELVARGWERARLFTWREAAEKLIAFYERMGG